MPVVVWCLASLLSVQLVGPLHAQQRLPSLGDSVSDEFDVSTERRLGDQVMRDIRRDPDYLDDPVLLDYLASLWRPLVAAARERGEIGADIDGRFAWEAFLVRDRSVNAFALPGAYVGVHLGLMGMTATRDELASVLAHELSHVTQRHIARSIGSQRRQSIVGMAAMILGVLAAAKTRSADGANAAIAGSQALMVQGQLNFSRDMEREADRIGSGLMSTAGFSASGMAAMFEKLDHASRLNDSGGFPYLRSHPLTTDRIGEARARAGSMRGAALGSPPQTLPSALVHTLAQARARVLMDTRAVALRRWQQLVPAAANAASASLAEPSLQELLLATYSDALASTLLREWPRADQAMARAEAALRTRSQPDRAALRFLGLLAAQSLLARGEPARAAAALKPWLSEAASSRPVMLLLAEWAELSRDEAALQRSAELLQSWTGLSPLDAGAWQALGRVWRAQGFALRALRAEGESRFALGDINGAVDRLRAGQRLARSSRPVDFIEASVIEVRLRDAELLRTKLAQEKLDL